MTQRASLVHGPGRTTSNTTTTTVRRLRAGLAAAAILLGPAPAHAGAEVVLAVSPNPGSLPIYIAEAEGFFAAEGVAARMASRAFGKLSLRLLLDGKAQLCTVADLPIVLASFGSERFAIVATLNTNRDDTKIVTRRSSGIRGAADLVGRKVGTYTGTTAHYAFDSLLLLEDLDPARVTLVNLEPGEGKSRLLAGSVDAVALFEPWAFEAAQALGDDALVLQTRRVYPQTFNLVAAPAPRGPSSAELAAVLRALDRATRLIERDPARAKALLSARLKLDAALVESSWVSLGYNLGLNQSLFAMLEGEARWALRLGLVQGPNPNFLGFIQSEPLRRIRPDSVTLVQ